MKIWVLEPNKKRLNNPWRRDKVALCFVVRALIETDARDIAADNSFLEGRRAWLDHKLSTCSEIGLALNETTGVISKEWATA